MKVWKQRQAQKHQTNSTLTNMIKRLYQMIWWARSSRIFALSDLTKSSHFSPACMHEMILGPRLDFSAKQMGCKMVHHKLKCSFFFQQMKCSTAVQTRNDIVKVMKFEQLYTFMAGGYLLHYFIECYSTFFSKTYKCKKYAVANKNSTILLGFYPLTSQLKYAAYLEKD